MPGIKCPCMAIDSVPRLVAISGYARRGNIGMRKIPTAYFVFFFTHDGISPSFVYLASQEEQCRERCDVILSLVHPAYHSKSFPQLVGRR